VRAFEKVVNMTAPKVLFVSHASSVSGAEMVLLDVVPAFRSAAAFVFEPGTLANELAKRDIPVIASRFGSGLDSIKRDSRLAGAAPFAGRMAGLVAELSLAARRFDVIYANSQKAFVIGTLASALSRRPLVWHLHDIIDRAHFGDAQRRMQISLANRFARLVITPSLAVKSAFVVEGGQAELTRIIPNGIDLAVESTSKAVLRQRLGLPNVPMIGVFSRIAAWKGQHVVLRAMAKLPDVHCIIVGSALFGEDRYEKSLMTLNRKLGLEQRVTFLGHRSDVPQLMQAVDAVVHPSVDPEPFGRTLVEAMLVGTPIIATDTGAAREILKEAAILVQPGDSDALASALRRVLSDGGRIGREDLAKACKRASTTYGVAAMQTKIAQEVHAAANSDPP
jgi:glycosyltransferase involved in cell wall biosynthesis